MRSNEFEREMPVLKIFNREQQKKILKIRTVTLAKISNIA